MPRCLMNTVRGYREGKYWGCEADSQNVMRTRSGLVISTVPKLRTLPSSFTSRPGTNTPSIVSPTSAPEKPCDPYKKFNVVQRKSMSCLSFVTRFGLIKEGIPYHFPGSPLDTEDWVDDDTFSHGKGSLESTTDTSSVASSESEDMEWGEDQPKFMNILHHNLRPVEKPPEGLQQSSESSESNDMALDVGGVGHSYVYKERVSVPVTHSGQSGPSSSTNGVKYIYVRSPNNHAPNEKEKNKAVLTRETRTTKSPSKAVSLMKGKLPVSRLAERHPVLLQCISRDDVTEAAASLLSLAAGQPITTTKTFSGKKENPNVAPAKTTRCIMYKTNLKRPAPSSQTQEEAEERAMQGASDTTEDEDDTSSLASQSSADERFVQQASEVDDAFKEDLSRFQMECHAYTVDTSGQKIHRCTICDKVFTVLPAFMAHVTTHVRPKNRCNACGKIFSRSWLLKGHIRTHTGERPYTCRYAECGRSFADKSNLRSHTLIHTTKDKAYVCTKCQRAFAQKRYLHKHKLEVCKI